MSAVPFSRPSLGEVVYQCHASFCEIACGVLVGEKPMCRWDITGAIFMKRKIFLLSLVAAVLTLAIAGCKREGCTDPKATNYDSDAKKDNGNCIYPEPEPTPVVPTKEITLDWDWNNLWTDGINKDTVKKYADMEDVKFIFLNVVNEDDGSLSSCYNTNGFHMARDTLQTRFDISDKVRGSGTIYVHREFGAQVPDDVYGTGMHVSDSAWYAEKGYQIKRFGNTKNGETK